MDEKKGSPEAEGHLNDLLQVEQTCNSISLNWTSVKSLGTGPYTIKTMWKMGRESFSYFPKKSGEEGGTALDRDPFSATPMRV